MRAGEVTAQGGQQQDLLVVGLDIAKLKVDVCLRLVNGKYRNKVIRNSAAGFEDLVAWLHKHGAATAHLCMEATGPYWEALAEYMSDAGYVVSVVNPAQVKAYGVALGQRSKTDAADAQLIAEFCAQRKPDAWQAPPVVVRTLRALVARRDSLVALHTQEVTRLQVVHDSVKESVEAVLSTLQEQIKLIEKRIRQHIDDDPTLREQRHLLDSVPGLGDVSIPVLLSHYGGPARFASAKQAVAFAGLDVRHYESGSSVRGRPRISKKGNSKLRKTLFMPAIVTMRCTEWGRVFAQRLSSAGKPKMVIIAALMRKMVQITFAILRTRKAFDMKLHEQST
ncbi:IS110 family transposase [Comamonas sp. J-3]|jgi:transposase|uniref:IS110 family transposase n=1 Tax=Comamonas trifloxystrobinivorans TaxID=3350256 RepID=UPI003726B224